MLIRFFKKVDSNGKIFIPKVVTENFGKEYYLEVHQDKIVLIPVKKGGTVMYEYKGKSVFGGIAIGRIKVYSKEQSFNDKLNSEKRLLGAQNVKNAGYEISSQAKRLEKIYIRLAHRC